MSRVWKVQAAEQGDAAAVDEQHRRVGGGRDGHRQALRPGAGEGLGKEAAGADLPHDHSLAVGLGPAHLHLASEHRPQVGGGIAGMKDYIPLGVLPQPRPQTVQHGQQLPVLHTVKQGHSPQGPQIGLHGGLPSVAKATRLPYGSRKNG